jgi:hypothetical protein
MLQCKNAARFPAMTVSLPDAETLAIGSPA